MHSTHCALLCCLVFFASCSNSTIDFKPSASEDLLLTVRDNSGGKLIRIHDEGGKALSSQIESFPRGIGTVLGPLKNIGSFIALTPTNTDDGTTFLVWSQNGSIKKTFENVGSHVRRIAYMPETSQLLQVDVAPDGCGCSDGDSSQFYVNLYKIAESQNDVSVTRVARMQLPGYATRCYANFRLAKGKPIFGIVEDEIPPFVGEVIGNEIRVLTPPQIEPSVEIRKQPLTLPPSDFGLIDYDLWPERDWIVSLTTIKPYDDSETSNRVELVVTNWKTGATIGKPYTAKHSDTFIMPVAFIEENRVAIASGSQFIVLARTTEDDLWTEEKTLPISFEYPYPTAIRMVGKHTAVVISNLDPWSPSSHKVLNF